MSEPIPRKRSSPLIWAGLFLALFVGVWVWRVSRRIPDIAYDKRTEKCRLQLTSLWTAERAYFAEYDNYAEELNEVGFTVEPSEIAIITSELGPWSPSGLATGDSGALGDVLSESDVKRAIATAKTRGTTVGTTGTCPSCSLTMLCARQLDGDDALDVWSISTEDRVSADGRNPMGVPRHDVDDSKE